MSLIEQLRIQQESCSTVHDRRHVQVPQDLVAHVARHLVVHAVVTKSGERPQGRLVDLGLKTSWSETQSRLSTESPAFVHLANARCRLAEEGGDGVREIHAFARDDDRRRALCHSNELDDKGGRLPSCHELGRDKCHTRRCSVWDDGPQLVLSGMSVPLADLECPAGSRFGNETTAPRSSQCRGGDCHIELQGSDCPICVAKVGNQSVAHTNMETRSTLPEQLGAASEENDVATLPRTVKLVLLRSNQHQRVPREELVDELELVDQVAFEPALCCPAGSASMKTDGSLELTGKLVMYASLIKSSSRAASD